MIPQKTWQILIWILYHTWIVGITFLPLRLQRQTFFHLLTWTTIMMSPPNIQTTHLQSHENNQQWMKRERQRCTHFPGDQIQHWLTLWCLQTKFLSKESQHMQQSIEDYSPKNPTPKTWYKLLWNNIMVDLWSAIQRTQQKRVQTISQIVQIISQTIEKAKEVKEVVKTNP